MTSLKQFNNTYQPPKKMEELQEALLTEQDSQNMDEIIKAMNVHLKKKEAVRISKLANLEDKVQEQMTKRITERGDCFSNKDLLDYYKVIHDIINKEDFEDTAIQAKQIQVNQQVNISLDKPTMSREERMQVANVVKDILDRARSSGQVTGLSQIIDGQFIEEKDVDK